MSEMAAAFRQAGLPEADPMTRDADEYRQCLLEVIGREQYVEPETKLSIIPNRVGQNRASCVDRGWLGNGPMHLFGTGLLKPTDERFETMVEFARRKFGITMGVMEHYRGGSEWYCNQTERGYYQGYLGRGEIERSLLVFYSNLAYSGSSDTYQTSERFHSDDPNFSAFQPNMSGNGRILDMMRRMLIDRAGRGRGSVVASAGLPTPLVCEGGVDRGQEGPDAVRRDGGDHAFGRRHRHRRCGFARLGIAQRDTGGLATSRPETRDESHRERQRRFR